MKLILKYLLIILALLTVEQVFSQSKRDYTWIWSNNPSPLPGNEGSIMTFNTGKRVMEYEALPYQIGSNNASISDEEGNLLFYTNGCQVISGNHELMENGDSLNYGAVWEDFTDNCDNGYPGLGNTITLTDPAYENGYYIIHKILDYVSKPDDFDIYVPNMSYSYVDMEQNGGYGKVIEKNVCFFDTDSIVSGYTTAIKKKDEDNWWIIQMADFENAYYKFLLSETGIAIVDTQYLGPIFSENTSSSGQAKFSPDGEFWAMFNNSEGLLVYNFDRLTGELSDLRRANVPMEFGFCGMEFSPNSRFIYLSTRDSLWQVDLWDENWENTIELIASWDGFSDPFPTNFHLMQLGPDCRIYMTSTNGTRSMHVINEPNEKGESCNFIQHGVSFPFTINPGSMPNFPRFGIGEDQICDPTITHVFNVPVLQEKLIELWPNPAHSELHVLPPEELSYPLTLKMFNILGQQISEQIAYRRETLDWDISTWMKGMYVLVAQDVNGQRLTKNFVVHR